MFLFYFFSESIDDNPEEVKEQPNHEQNVEQIPNDELQQTNVQTNDVIVLTEDDEDFLGLENAQSSQESGSKNEPKMEQAVNKEAENIDQNRSKSESSNLSDNNNNNNDELTLTAHDSPKNLNLPNKVPETIAKDAIDANKSHKRKAPSSSTRRYEPMRRIEYLSDSDGDGDGDDGVNRDDDRAAEENGQDIGHENVDNNQNGHVNEDEEDLFGYDSNSNSASDNEPMYPD